MGSRLKLRPIALVLITDLHGCKIAGTMGVNFCPWAEGAAIKSLRLAVRVLDTVDEYYDGTHHRRAQSAGKCLAFKIVGECARQKIDQ